ncbi:MAG: tRNA (5-methylaminomethyl-2-thiouridine)(34)-methyltransferase MnmD [Bacteriovorax sp.]
MTEFKGNLGNYKIVKTEDDTETVWSEFFNEACHNLSGAYEETLHNYIQGCSIPYYLDRNLDFALLDVGFGVGVGLKALIDQVKAASNFTSRLCYYSIELDETLLLWSLKTTLPFLDLLRKEEGELNYYEGSFGQIEIKIFVGDGRLTLPRAHALSQIKMLDAIFQDAFSPKKNPALWSVEWFSFLKQISSPSVRLSTYSSSISIRKSLLAAGWAIENARGFALKRTMTKANLTGTTSEELLDQMKRSPSLEIRDK